MLPLICGLYSEKLQWKSNGLSGLVTNSKLLAGSLGAQDYIGGNGLADDLHLWMSSSVGGPMDSICRVSR